MAVNCCCVNGDVRCVGASLAPLLVVAARELADRFPACCTVRWGELTVCTSLPVVVPSRSTSCWTCTARASPSWPMPMPCFTKGSRRLNAQPHQRGTEPLALPAGHHAVRPATASGKHPDQAGQSKRRAVAGGSLPRRIQSCHDSRLPVSEVLPVAGNGLPAVGRAAAVPDEGAVPERLPARRHHLGVRAGVNTAGASTLTTGCLRHH